MLGAVGVEMCRGRLAEADRRRGEEQTEEMWQTRGNEGVECGGRETTLQEGIRICDLGFGRR